METYITGTNCSPLREMKCVLWILIGIASLENPSGYCQDVFPCKQRLFAEYFMYNISCGYSVKFSHQDDYIEYP